MHKRGAENLPQKYRNSPQVDLLPTMKEWKQLQEQEVVEYSNYTEVNPVTNKVINNTLGVIEFVLVVSLNVFIGSIFVLILLTREMLSRLFMTTGYKSRTPSSEGVTGKKTNVVTNVNINVDSSQTNVTTNININQK